MTRANPQQRRLQEKDCEQRVVYLGIVSSPREMVFTAATFSREALMDHFAGAIDAYTDAVGKRWDAENVHIQAITPLP